MYVTGRGVDRDDKEAMKWYRRSAEQGYASAQLNLGYLYDAGLGTQEDDVRAHMWYRVAGTNGDKKGN